MSRGIHALSNQRLSPFLKPYVEFKWIERDLRVDAFLKETLMRANDFVPSKSGSVFLVDPTSLAGSDFGDRDRNLLTAVACFGPKSGDFVGKRIEADRGIVGHVYTTGQAYLSKNVKRDRHFANEFDKKTGHKTLSVLCVPIALKRRVIGVLELMNKTNAKTFSHEDFELLKIFAGYISASLQNFIDAKRHEDLSRRDNLTGLSNDRHMHQMLERETKKCFRKKKDVGVIFLDLDRFKEVNDEHGHLAGSRVLVEVGGVIRDRVHWPGAELARYGGDEFVVVLPGASLHEAVEVAEDIRRGIEKTVFLSRATTEVPAHRIEDQVTASVGVATLLSNVGCEDRNALLKAADVAMYESKRLGKNRVTVAQRVTDKSRAQGSGVPRSTRS